MSDNERLGAAIKLVTSELMALVALLTKHQQAEWIRIHETNCQRMKIDPVTGAPVDPDIDKSGNASDLS